MSDRGARLERAPPVTLAAPIAVCPARERRLDNSCSSVIRASPSPRTQRPAATGRTDRHHSDVAGDDIRITRSVSLPLAEITFRVSRSSGPSGQHANTAETRVEAVFDVEASSALTERQKRRVLAKVGPVIRTVAQDERSQSRNRELALEWLGRQQNRQVEVHIYAIFSRR